MRKVAPSPGAVSSFGVAAVGLGDRGDDRKPEAGAAARARARRIGTPEPFERARRLLVVHAGAVVAHLDDRLVVGLARPALRPGVNGGVWVRAFSSRFASTWRRRNSSPLTTTARGRLVGHGTVG